MENSREYTTDEIREKFMDHVRELINYWDNVDRETSKEKIEGFAHSLLATIDGSSMDLPGFVLAPSSHHTDKQYHIDNDDNYYPENESDSDIAGSLHERLYK